jgi:hypothetical protein
MYKMEYDSRTNLYYIYDEENNKAFCWNKKEIVEKEIEKLNALDQR